GARMHGSAPWTCTLLVAVTFTKLRCSNCRLQLARAPLWESSGPLARLRHDAIDRRRRKERHPRHVGSRVTAGARERPRPLWGQFGVDNSVSVHHYCFPCIKLVSLIHGKTSKTDRR